MIKIEGIDEIIEKALKEDIGLGDITTQSIISDDQYICGQFIAKETGVICGVEVIKRVFEKMDERIQLKIHTHNGDTVNKGDIIAYIEGPAAGILTGERVALNFIQRLSSIATQTAKYVEEVKGTGAKITDTRKTTPGLRVLEKYAVKVGGGFNHRFNLTDGLLIKDNHIKAAGSIKNAILAVRKNAPHTLKIEVEVESMKEVDEALEAGADIIMLDNMSNEEMREAVSYINGRALVEASGNMGEKDIRAVAMTGVDLISVGALTHTVKAMDISLKFQ